MTSSMNRKYSTGPICSHEKIAAIIFAAIFSCKYSQLIGNNRIRHVVHASIHRFADAGALDYWHCSDFVMQLQQPRQKATERLMN